MASSPPRSGLATKSRAPSSSDLKTSPRRELEERTITGVGRCAISRRRKVKPSMRGICRSRTMASGRSAITSRRACSPSRAWPTTSKSPVDSSIPCSSPRLSAESSTSSIRSRPRWAGALTAPLRRGARLAEDQLPVEVDQLEVGAELQQRLGVAEQQPAAVAQPVVEVAQHAPPGRGVEVEQHVAAEDHVEGRRRQPLAVEQVGGAEADQAAERLVDHPAPLLQVEPAPQRLALGAAEGVLAVGPGQRRGPGSGARGRRRAPRAPSPRSAPSRAAARPACRPPRRWRSRRRGAAAAARRPAPAPAPGGCPARRRAAGPAPGRSRSRWW